MEGLARDQVPSPDDQPSDLRSPLLGADERLTDGVQTFFLHKVKKKLHMRVSDWTWVVLMTLIILAGIVLIVLAELEPFP
jgi:hypothetical protein